MNNFIIIISAIFILSNSSVIMADELEFPEKQATAREQIRLADKPPRNRIKDTAKQVKAWKAVEHYFPDDKLAIKTAKNNMALMMVSSIVLYKGEWYTEFAGEARKICFDLLTTYPEDKLTINWLRCYVTSLKADFANDNGLKFLNEICKKFPQKEVELKLHYSKRAIQWMASFYYKNATDVNTIANEIHTLLGDVLLYNENLTIQQGMVIRHLLGQIPTYKLIAKRQLNWKKSKGNMVDTIIKKNEILTEGFEYIPPFFSDKQLMTSEVGFEYTIKQNKNTFRYIINYIMNDAQKNKSLDKHSISALSFLDTFYVLASKDDEVYLKRSFELIDNEENKKKLFDIGTKISLYLKSQLHKIRK